MNLKTQRCFEGNVDNSNLKEAKNATLPEGNKNSNLKEPENATLPLMITRTLQYRTEETRYKIKNL
ncbi:MAG: hypothetical protein IJO64_01425 [Clostridia bacterium]|nr:hypothetical protein [Clostridia bacterium]